METSNVAHHNSVHAPRVWMGIMLLGLGLLGHLLAARAIGGSETAYRHHIAGFVGIALVTGGIIAIVGRLFWKGRHDVTVLVVGLVQALAGFAIYLDRFHIG